MTLLPFIYNMIIKMKRIKIFLFFLLNLFLGVRICFAVSIREEARNYRQKGYEAQISGNLDLAFTYYQKAILMDPYYITVYNDLGIIYEMKGYLDKAEEMYLKTIQLDPKYLASYSNLALLYERKNDVLKAADFWEKRILLGGPPDPWIQKAKERLSALGMVSPEIKKVILEIEAAELSKQILEEKIAKVKIHLGLGKNLYSRGKYEEAIREFKEVLSLEPEHPEAKELLEKSIHKITELKIRELSKKAIKYYTAKNYSQSLKEFEKILIYLQSIKDLSGKISK